MTPAAQIQSAVNELQSQLAAALAFLKSAGDGGRIVSSNDLKTFQITEARL